MSVICQKVFSCSILSSLDCAPCTWAPDEFCLDILGSGGTVVDVYALSQGFINLGDSIGPWTWSKVGDDIPGMVITLDTDDGAGNKCFSIEGTPTDYGLYSFTVTVTDSSVPVRTAQRAYVYIIGDILSPTSLPPCSVGVPYSYVMDSIGIPGDLTWSLDPFGAPLPAGLSLDSVTGEIYGTPTETGLHSPTICVTSDLVCPGLNVLCKTFEVGDVVYYSNLVQYTQSAYCNSMGPAGTVTVVVDPGDFFSYVSQLDAETIAAQQAVNLIEYTMYLLGCPSELDHTHV